VSDEPHSTTQPYRTTQPHLPAQQPARPGRSLGLRTTVLRTVVLAVLLVAVWAHAAGATGDGGAAPVPASTRVVWPEVPPGTYHPPVDAPVIDPFRAPATPWGPGNRGLEYATDPGSPVRAIGAGRIVFAGQVGGRLAVTVLHPDGRRSSYSDLESIEVGTGQLVPRGTVVGRAGRTFHLGLREGERYVDPAPFLHGRRRAVLIPHR
jgi:murein DD-endopeptidase MepM/ murein hydrolase activator NlpD